MEWNVYYYNINKKKIESFNIFDHWGFREDVKKVLSKFKNKEDFENQLISELRYYFWGKAEWETILSPWCGGDRERDAIKIDVHDQVMLNWDLFVQHVWDHRKELLNES